MPIIPAADQIVTGVWQGKFWRSISTKSRSFHVWFDVETNTLQSYSYTALITAFARRSIFFNNFNLLSFNSITNYRIKFNTIFERISDDFMLFDCIYRFKTNVYSFYITIAYNSGDNPRSRVYFNHNRELVLSNDELRGNSKAFKAEQSWQALSFNHQNLVDFVLVSIFVSRYKLLFPTVGRH